MIEISNPLGGVMTISFDKMIPLILKLEVLDAVPYSVFRAVNDPVTFIPAGVTIKLFKV